MSERAVGARREKQKKEREEGEGIVKKEIKGKMHRNKKETEKKEKEERKREEEEQTERNGKRKDTINEGEEKRWKGGHGRRSGVVSPTNRGKLTIKSPLRTGE